LEATFRFCENAFINHIFEPGLCPENFQNVAIAPILSVVNVMRTNQKKKDNKTNTLPNNMH